MVFTWRLLKAEEKEITSAANLIKFVNIHWQVLLSLKITPEVVHPNVSDHPGLLLQVILAVHGLVDHILTY